MKHSIRFIASFYVILSSLTASAQDSLQTHINDSTRIAYEIASNYQENDSTQIDESDKSDSINLQENNFYIYIGTDYGKLITTAAQLENKYEFNIGFLFAKNIRLTADYGYAKLSPPNAIQNGFYNSSGHYYRLGLDYMLNIAPKTYLSFGGMYALSNFKDEGTVEISSEVWPSFSQSFTRDNLKASWAEFVITTEAPILNRETGFLHNLHWGIKFRFRFLIDRPTPENFEVYAIPGYGRTWNNFVPAANLFIMYKL